MGELSLLAGVILYSGFLGHLVPYSVETVNLDAVTAILTSYRSGGPVSVGHIGTPRKGCCGLHHSPPHPPKKIFLSPQTYEHIGNALGW